MTSDKLVQYFENHPSYWFSVQKKSIWLPHNYIHVSLSSDFDEYLEIIGHRTSIHKLKQTLAKSMYDSIVDGVYRAQERLTEIDEYRTEDTPKKQAEDLRFSLEFNRERNELQVDLSMLYGDLTNERHKSTIEKAMAFIQAAYYDPVYFDLIGIKYFQKGLDKP